MSERDLRRRCRQLLKDLDIQPPLDVEELCRRFAQQRGRPIHLVPYAIPVPGPFGLWISAQSEDFIVFQENTSRPHKRHIILHEFGHGFRGHVSGVPLGLLSALGRGDVSAALDTWFPVWPAGPIGCAFGRTAYDDEREREAETVATVILEWASVLDHVVPKATDHEAAQRIAAALSDRLGWL
ncbi:hypothetical protein [Streptomyces sp. NPDC059010]|uniref:hypothetical protein n=1 Tax=Streptomyces sp. NPDC059010 TaxID=3346695 RepID=UPI00367549D8